MKKNVKKIVIQSAALMLSGLAMLPTYAAGHSLKEIMQAAMTSDPKVLEAKANIAISETKVKISEAGHYPVVGVATRQNVSSHYNDNYNHKSRSTNALQAKLNLYAWGEIENSVIRDKHAKRYTEHKYHETQEQLGRTIGEIYLKALSAKESIAVYKESLNAYNKILNDLGVISSYDVGRESEVVEARSRQLQAEANLLSQQRILETSLSQLSRYTGSKINASDLRDPFEKMTPELLKSKYTGEFISQNPSYLAQQEELEKVRAQEKVSKAKRLPAINLEGEANRHGYEVNLNVAWNFYDPATYYTGEQDAHSYYVAQARLQEIEREVQENSQTAEISMRQSQQYLKVSSKQIQSQRNVIGIYEDQFLISMRSLIDLLDAHQTLSNLQIADVTAKNDYRSAVLAYLVAQAQLSNWAGVITLKGL